MHQSVSFFLPGLGSSQKVAVIQYFRDLQLYSGVLNHSDESNLSQLNEVSLTMKISSFGTRL